MWCFFAFTKFMGWELLNIRTTWSSSSLLQKWNSAHATTLYLAVQSWMHIPQESEKEEAAAAGNIPGSPPSSMARVVTVHFGLYSNLFPNHCVWTCHYVVMNSVECPSGIQSSNAHLISACKGYRYWSNCLGNAEQKVLGIQSAWWPFGASCTYKYGTVGIQKVEFSCYYKLCTSAHLSRRPWIKDCLGMCLSFSYPHFFQ